MALRTFTIPNMDSVVGRHAFFAEALKKLDGASNDAETTFLNVAVEVSNKMEDLGYTVESLLKLKLSSPVELSTAETNTFRKGAYLSLKTAEVLYVRGDGNCFFYSTSLAINGDPGFHKEYRVRACLFLLLEPERLIQGAETQARRLCPKQKDRPFRHSFLAGASAGCSHSESLEFEYVNQGSLQFLIPRDGSQKEALYIISEEPLRKILYDHAKAVATDNSGR